MTIFNERIFDLKHWRRFYKRDIMIDYNTPLETVDLPKDANEMRQMIVANALSIAGITASNPDMLETFTELLGPVSGQWDLKRPFSVRKVNGRWVTKGVSTCGLVARGLWRRVGVDMPQLYKNYNFGMAMIEEQNFCRSIKPYSAWHVPTKSNDMIPSPGDYIIIGSGLSTHNITCIGWNGDKLVSVDGGRVDPKTGLQCIEEVEREWLPNNGIPFLKDNRSSRKVIGWAMVDLLPYKNIASTPQGWEQVVI